MQNLKIILVLIPTVCSFLFLGDDEEGTLLGHNHFLIVWRTKWRANESVVSYCLFICFICVVDLPQSLPKWRQRKNNCEISRRFRVCCVRGIHRHYRRLSLQKLKSSSFFVLHSNNFLLASWCARQRICQEKTHTHTNRANQQPNTMARRHFLVFWRTADDNNSVDDKTSRLPLMGSW